MVEALLARLAGVHVLCLGDAMLDRYLYGEVERISPEAPIPVLRAQHSDSSLGGAGNVVRNIVSLGGKASLITLVGADTAAAMLQDQMQALGAGVLHYVPLVDASRPTPVKTRYVALRQQLLRYDEEATHPISEALTAACLARVDALLPTVSAVVLSDYGKGMLTPALCQAVVQRCQTRSVAVFVDPKGRDYTKYAGADYITPNRQELSLASAMPADTDAEVEAAAAALMRLYRIKGVFATRSEKGISYISTNEAPVHMPTEARAVFDVSGAGDTVIASLALCIGGGVPVTTAMTFANKAAGIVVGKKGTAVATLDEMRRAYAVPVSMPVSKLYSHDDLQQTIRLWRQQNLRVGFTNGCFDLLHAGHIATLTAARQSCDRLIVALNSDASVRRLKGETRPLQPVADRHVIMAALCMVDAVTVFEEDTPLALITRLQPDVLIKGGDYQADTVVGADVVKARGGKVVIVDTLPGRSTTRLSEQLANLL